MRSLRLLYRDYDRSPYLYVLRHAAMRRGLVLELTKVELSGRYAEFLLEGATDVLAENYWALQSLAASGTPLVSLATAVARLNEMLFVHPGIERVEDLRDKSVALRSVGPSELAVRLWLKDRGLDTTRTVVVPESEVGRWGHWKTIQSGHCHAAFITDFYQDEPLQAGLKPLPIPPYGFIGNVTLTSLEPLVDARRQDFADLVAAAFEAAWIFRHDRAATLKIMRAEPQSLLDVDDDALLRLYDILRNELSDYPVPTPEAISNTHRMRLAKTPGLGRFNPLLMWDLSFARRAMREQEPDHRP